MRSNLRLADLLQPKKTPVKLMNVKVPAAVSAAVGRVARELGVRKNEAVIALINEGLDAAAEQLKLEAEAGQAATAQANLHRSGLREGVPGEGLVQQSLSVEGPGQLSRLAEHRRAEWIEHHPS